MPPSESSPAAPYLVLLGVAQDAGYPQAGCNASCCRSAWENPERRRRVVCLALVDPPAGRRWLFECTPDFREQLQALDRVTAPDHAGRIDGILLTHAHVGHYAGLIHLGREAMSATRVPVHVMPRMRRFLEDNLPWRRLVADGNITLCDLADRRPAPLGERLIVTPFQVPHRDELSETVCFHVAGPDRSALFLPDIDAWDRWDTAIEDLLRSVDVAYLDGTFHSHGELPGRDPSQVPHPTITDSIARFAPLPAPQRKKIRFLHFNHTNPVLDPDSPESRSVRAAGCGLAAEGEMFAL